MLSRSRSLSLTLLALLLISSSAWADCPDDVDSDADHQLIVFSVSGLLGRVVTPRYMPLVHKYVTQGTHTTSMRTTHDTKHSKLGWISAFFASSSSEFGCDDNGCDSVPRVSDDMRSWVDMLEQDHGYAVTLLSERRDVMVDVLERDDVDGFHQCTMRMFRHLVDATLPNAHRRLLLFDVGCVDRLGHVSGFGGFNYFAQVACLDRQLSFLIDKLWAERPNSTTFMLMANHGGTDFGHASFEIQTIQVPFAMWGYGVAQDVDLWDQPTEVEQIGPSLLTALGYSDCIPSSWLYHPITGIYDNADYAVYAPPDESYEDVRREECAVPQSVDHASARRTASIHLYILIAILFLMVPITKRFL